MHWIAGSGQRAGYFPRARLSLTFPNCLRERRGRPWEEPFRVPHPPHATRSYGSGTFHHIPTAPLPIQAFLEAVRVRWLPLIMYPAVKRLNSGHAWIASPVAPHGRVRRRGALRGEEFEARLAGH